MYEANLKYCPDCRDEYRAEIVTCAGCGRTLLTGAEMLAKTRGGAAGRGPARPIAEGEHDLVPVGKAPLAEARRLEKALLGQGIAARIMGMGGGCGKGCGGAPEVEIFVRRQDFQDAMELLHRDYEARTGLHHHDTALARQGFQGPGNLCPACGSAIAPTDPECPDCGLCL